MGTPLSPEIITRQVTLTIGTIGHVAHGKSTVVHAITGVHTQRSKKEQKHNITIKLGYANAKIFRCPRCPKPKCFQAHSSSKLYASFCWQCDSLMDIVRHVSFADCPGHESMMATMLNGTAVMDGALLIIAANEECPPP